MLSILSLLLIVSMMLFAVSPNFVTASKSFCDDQVGDGHHCFATEKKCKQVQKHDDVAESPCYQ